VKADDEMHEPPIHIVPAGDKWGICLSRLGKWIAGVAAGLVTAGFIAMISLEINNAIQLGRHGEKIEMLGRRIDGTENALQSMAGENRRRIERLEWRDGQ